MIELINLHKEFKVDNGVNKVLKGIDLKINDGDFITIIGSNGSGKSTLLNVLAGTHKVDEGKIIFDGKDVTNLKEHKRASFIGRVFQDPLQGTIGDISIEENFALAFKRGQKRSLKWALKKEYLETYKETLAPLNLNLENRLHEKIKTLSGGQRQACTLLMATLVKPSLLLLDEHTAALDPKTSKTIMKLTDDIIKNDNLTALMITHNMKDAIKYGNRIICLSNGKIIFDAQGEEKAKLTVDDLYKKFEEAEAN